MSAVGISAAISLDKSALIEYSVPERALLVGFTPACSLEAKQTAALASYGFPQQHHKLARDQSSSSSSSETAALSVTQQPSVRLSCFLLFWDWSTRAFSSKKHDRYGDFYFLFAAVWHHCFQKLSCSVLGYFPVPGGPPPPSSHLARRSLG